MTTPGIAEVIGAGVREVRTSAGLTLDQVARAMRERGFRWSTARVVELENGRRSVTVQTLVGVAVALAKLTRQPPSIARLIPGEGPVRVADGLVLPASVLRSLFGGEPTALPWGEIDSAVVERVSKALDTWGEGVSAGGASGVTMGALSRAEEGAGAAEDHVSRSLGVSRATLVGACAALWGRSLTDERDQRAGPDANAQKRGRVTRELVAELREHLAQQAESPGDGEH